MDGGTLTVLVTVSAGFLGTLTTQIFQTYTRARDRRWDVEDRIRVAADAKAHQEVLVAALAENTTLTHVAAAKADAAYREANQVNLKIASIGAEVADTGKPVPTYLPGAPKP